MPQAVKAAPLRETGWINPPTELFGRVHEPAETRAALRIDLRRGAGLRRAQRMWALKKVFMTILRGACRTNGRRSLSALESKFPVVRRELIESNFTAWATHREFLLEYAQMLRARSRLFRAQATTYTRQSIIGAVGLKGKPYIPEEQADHEQRLRNMTITQMRLEIAKGSGLFSKLHWCLRLTKDVSHPAITADAPVIALGSSPETPVLQEAVLLDANSWIVFPVCRKPTLLVTHSRWKQKRKTFSRQASCGFKNGISRRSPASSILHCAPRVFHRG